MENIIIIGTGCAGFTAGIYAARANLNPLILEGKQPGGQLTTTSEVENFPGFPEGVDGFMLMDNLRKQALKFGARIQNTYVDSVSLNDSKKVLTTAGKSIEAKGCNNCNRCCATASRYTGRKRNVWWNGCYDLRDL
jgi:thioredoxin reductase (NADPH)